MPFFLPGKRKSTKSGVQRKKVKSHQRAEAGGKSKPKRSEEISSDSDSSLGHHSDNDALNTNSLVSVQETADEKKLRLTKQYISELEEHEKNDDRLNVVDRLESEALEISGKLFTPRAHFFTDRLSALIPEKLSRYHGLSVTCIALTRERDHVYSGAKDGSVAKWCATTGKRVCSVPGLRKVKEGKTEGSKEGKTGVGKESKTGESKGGKPGEQSAGHSSDVLAIAISSDNEFLCTAGRDRCIQVWDPLTLSPLRRLTGHRGPVTGLCFRLGHHQLYSAAADRSVKVWNLDEFAYVETLFGHEDAIAGIDCLARERVATVGTRDKSLRVWKIPEESQLVFETPSGCGIDAVESVRLLDEENVLTGGDNGSICLWWVRKKRPSCVVRRAHGPGGAAVCPGGAAAGTGGAAANPSATPPSPTFTFPVISLATVTNSDVFASGSRDGSVRIWKVLQRRTISPIGAVTLDGFVNGLCISNDATRLWAAVGQEHRLGRWWRNATARNCVYLIRLDNSWDEITNNNIPRNISQLL